MLEENNVHLGVKQRGDREGRSFAGLQEDTETEADLEPAGTASSRRQLLVPCRYVPSR